MTENFALKDLPYGKVDFSSIRLDGCAYVDKTRYIEVLEKSGGFFPFIVRPRRFGKTLFTSILEAYYDKYRAKDFEKNFAGTYIGEHKTPLANSFYTLHFDFSGLASSSDLPLRFQSSVKSSISRFFKKYPHPRQNEILQKDFVDAAALAEDFFALLDDEYHQKIYVIIDEYDQFANEILSNDVQKFKSITSTDGFYKDFFATLKKATYGAVGRVFITGVSSFSLDSVTSGFNVATKITTHPSFAGMFGFNETELGDLIEQTVDLKACNLTLEEVLSDMKEWYNGYRFSARSSETVFNSTMCLYYLRSLKTTLNKPDTLLDSNLGQDLGKIEGILSLGDFDFVKKILEKALNRSPIDFKPEPSDLNLNREEDLDEDAVLSALFYMGFLTFDEKEEDALVIPNRAIQEQFFAYFLKHILKTKQFRIAAKGLRVTLPSLLAGDPEPFLRFICNRFDEASGLHAHSNVRESDFRTLLLNAFLYTDIYDVQNEVEIRGSEKGYADLLVIPKEKDEKNAAYLIEIKQLKSGAKEKAIEDKVREAREQLERYEAGENTRHISNLKKLICVFVGMKLRVIELVD